MRLPCEGFIMCLAFGSNERGLCGYLPGMETSGPVIRLVGSVSSSPLEGLLFLFFDPLSSWVCPQCILRRQRKGKVPEAAHTPPLTAPPRVQIPPGTKTEEAQGLSVRTRSLPSSFVLQGCHTSSRQPPAFPLPWLVCQPPWQVPRQSWDQGRTGVP